MGSGSPVKGGGDKKAEFVDETGGEKRTVDRGASLQQQPADAKFTAERVQHCGKIQFGRFGDDVGDAVGRQFGQMAVRRVAAQKHHDMIAADVGPGEVEPARGIDHDGVAAGAASRKMMRPVNRARLRRRMRGGLAHLSHRHAPDDPGVALKRLMNPLVYPRPIGANAIGADGEAAGMEASIQRRDHMADDVRLHGVLS